jgi:hypothetical protein
MASDDGGSCPLARAMRETLDAVVTPVVREALIHDALMLAGLGELPQRGDAMRAFTGEYLRAVVARALGAEMAASITEEILLTIGPSTLPPGVARASTQRPARAPPHRRLHTPPPKIRRTPVVVRALRDTDPAGEPPSVPSTTPSATPFLFVATEDAELLRTVAEACEGRARVCSVRTPAELVKRLEALDNARSLVLLDGQSPALRPAAAAVLLEDWLSIEVVFCRARPEAEAFALSVSPSVGSWVVYTEEVPLADVALYCVERLS